MFDSECIPHHAVPTSRYSPRLYGLPSISSTLSFSGAGLFTGSTGFAAGASSMDLVIAAAAFFGCVRIAESLVCGRTVAGRTVAAGAAAGLVSVGEATIGSGVVVGKLSVAMAGGAGAGGGGDGDFAGAGGVGVAVFAGAIGGIAGSVACTSRYTTNPEAFTATNTATTTRVRIMVAIPSNLALDAQDSLISCLVANVRSAIQ